MKKLKNAFVVWISIYPAITFITFVFGNPLSRLPLSLRTLVLTVVLVPLMVYVLVPFWAKVIQRASALMNPKLPESR